MYIVKDENGEVVLIASRREDAEAICKTKLDNVKYSIEEVKNE